MFAAERYEKIGDLAAAEGRVSVAGLADRFNITQETVRRDLAALEIDGVVRRVHGGAVAAAKRSTGEQSLTSRQSQHHEQKLRIARKAVDLIPAGSSVVIDAGTTTELLADLLQDWQSPRPEDNLLVITHAVPIAAKLSNSPALELEMLGGRVRGLTRASVGAATVKQLENLRPDIAIVGTNGVHPGFGFSTPDAQEAAVKSAIVRSARRVVVLADASKLEEEALVRFAALDDVDALITDTAPEGALADALREAGTEVVPA
ncbi:DeoR/GlpR family DNA-binding transcription regulator [Arthrobacter castelli]|uniref:DeoR/GlpR family DNA-binding transcription regulator n=1 Tax=Arthrobacter castelli TaxID=271431 RepID=UPI0004249834|nr:DeoR/GlpR family DNA-binding transcription regulator [Arthrobacter castelli]